MNEIVAGIDIGGTNTVIGLVSKNGDCLIEETISTRNHNSFVAFIEALSHKINNIHHHIGEENYSLKGIGIGAPNGAFGIGSIVDAPNLEWKGTLPICAEITKRTSLPSLVTNDANAAALGEMFFGGAKGMKDFIIITLGTGLGSGIVSNGKLVIGHDGFAGELGHTVAEVNGRMCGCGNRGCLETYASAMGIKRTVFMLLAQSAKPSTLRGINFEELTSKMVTEAALNGDTIALDAFEYTGRILGIKLADTVALFSPEAIFLFGGVAKAGNLIIEPTKRYMEEFMFPIFRNKVKLLPSGLEGKNAAVLGAAALIWQEIE
ncbi:MAG: ROK family protein [Bacteroidales bacterium]|nr:MAG: ROK family protein [Bacteroidales bacterium]